MHKRSNVGQKKCLHCMVSNFKVFVFSFSCQNHECVPYCSIRDLPEHLKVYGTSNKEVPAGSHIMIECSKPNQHLVYNLSSIKPDGKKQF